MRLNLRRGASFGALSAASFAAIIPLNNYIRGDQTTWDQFVVGTIFAFMLFGVIGIFTDRVGSDFGES